MKEYPFSIREQKKSKRLRRLKIVLFLFLILTIGLFSYSLIRFYQLYNKFFNRTKISPPISKTPEQRHTLNILLLGYGGGRHEGAFLTDTIMLASINAKKKEVIIISLPRDLWVNVPLQPPSTTPFHSKINALYQMGLFPENYPGLDRQYLAKHDPAGYIKYAATQITGLPIDGYVAIDFQGFVSAIDLLGGIEVDVDKSFTDYEYPIEGKETDLCGKEEKFAQIEKFLSPTANDRSEQEKLFQEKPELKEFFENITKNPPLAFPCRYETISFTAGKIQMNGETALKYARSRHSLEDGGDFNRANRQQKVIEAIKQKLLNIGIVTKFFPFLEKISPYITTDISREDIQSLLPELKNLSQYKTQHLVIAEPQYLTSSYSEDGQYILIPKIGIDNWTEIKNTVRLLLLNITLTPSPTIFTQKTKK